MSLDALHALLEQGAEDRRVDAAPVLVAGSVKRGQLVASQLDGIDLREYAAIEVAHALEAPATRSLAAVHLSEQRTEKVPRACALHAFEDQLRERTPRQESRVFGEHGHDALQREALHPLARFATFNERSKELAHPRGRDVGDGRAVIAEERLVLLAEHEVERRVPLRKVVQCEPVHRLVELRVEVANPELREVAENDEARSIPREREPVLHCLRVVSR